MNRNQAILLATCVMALGACSTQVRNTGNYVESPQQSGVTLPRPQRAIVAGFRPDQSEVQLDRAVADRLQRQFSGGDPTGQQAALSREVQEAILDSLTSDLSKMGFVTERAGPGVTRRPGDLLVEGDVVSVDQGNRTRRLAIGFGAGKSEVEANARVYYLGRDLTPRLLQTYSAQSNSGRRPGMGVGAAAGVAQSTAVPLAVSAGLGAHGEATKAGVAGEGQRLAHRISYNLGQFFVQQGWIDPSRAPSLELR